MVNSASISADILARRAAKAMPGATTAFLILDTESIPDGDLIRRVKYPDENIPPEEAIARAQAEVREQSTTGSDFLPVTFHYPVAVCVLRVADDYTLEAVTCLDAPQFRTEEIVRQFWRGIACYPRAKIVSFNGRGFDLPLLELAAYDYGFSARDYFLTSRNRFNGNHLDLMDWLTNFGASRGFPGGLDLLAKLIGKPGKMHVSGDQVYDLHRAGKCQEVNDYCLYDTLDTYFVFLRTRVLTGDVTLEQEAELIAKARKAIAAQANEMPALTQYLERWTDGQPWP